MTQIKNSTNKLMLIVVGLVLSAVTFTQGVFTRLGSGMSTSNIDTAYADVPTSCSNCFVVDGSNGDGGGCGLGCCSNGTQDGTCGESFGCGPAGDCAGT